ncbi:hypothetical protein QP519_11665, partial [Weeksella virosa]|uniref:hypothetical protein n=1 Tax=Weeksella virosa TaxID=1014 RepID=UPI002556C9B1
YLRSLSYRISSIATPRVNCLTRLLTRTLIRIIHNTERFCRLHCKWVGAMQNSLTWQICTCWAVGSRVIGVRSLES